MVIALAVLFAGIVTGFITFRIQGMGFAPHFVLLLLALVITLAGLGTGITLILWAAAIFQILAAITAYTRLWTTLKYNFQTAPLYAPHLALVTMLPVLAIAALIL